MSISRNDARFETTSSSDGPDYPRPLFCLADKFDQEDEVHKWAKQARDCAVKAAKKRQRAYRDNLAIYKGGSKKHEAPVGYSHLVEPPPSNSASPETAQVLVPFMHDHVEVRVARFSRYRDNLEVLPANYKDNGDRQAAEGVKELIAYLRYVTDFKRLLEKLGRRAFLAGESYLFAEWDPTKGMLHPEVDEALRNQQEPLIADAETGEPKPLPESEWRMGEVSFRVPKTDDVFLEPVPDGDFAKVDWVIERDLLHVEVVKKRYPDKADKIKEDTISTDDAELLSQGELDSTIAKSPKGFTWVYYLWHRKCPYLDDGRLIVFTEGGLLKNDPHPYEHKQLPCVRFTDVDIDGQLYPEALFSLNRHLNGLINNTYSMIYRYNALMVPKWVYPEAAQIKPKMVGNDVLGIEFRGAQPPKIESAPPMSGENFAFAQQMEDKLRQCMVVFPMSQGTVPPNIRAGVSMLFMDEQENERFDPEAKKHNDVVVQIWKLALDIVRQFYAQDDKRKYGVFGKTGSVEMKDFDPTILNSPFEIRLQNAPSLPESKAARTQYLLDIDERKPLPPEQFFEYLELGIPEAYTSEITKAKRFADSENEHWMTGQTGVPNPMPYHDGVAHLLRHYNFVQGKEFAALDPNVQRECLMHIQLHEMYEMQKTFIDYDMTRPFNPARAEILSQIPNFPLVFTPNTDRLSAQLNLEDEQMAAMQGSGGMAGVTSPGPQGPFGAAGGGAEGEPLAPASSPPATPPGMNVIEQKASDNAKAAGAAIPEPSVQ